MLCNSAPSLAGRTTMNDTYPSRHRTSDKPQEKRSLLERLTDFISPEPESRGELLEILQDAHERVYRHSLILEDARAQAAYGQHSAVGKVLEIHQEMPGRIHIVLIRQPVGY